MAKISTFLDSGILIYVTPKFILSAWKTPKHSSKPSSHWPFLSFPERISYSLFHVFTVLSASVLNHLQQFSQVSVHIAIASVIIWAP